MGIDWIVYWDAFHAMLQGVNIYMVGKGQLHYFSFFWGLLYLWPLMQFNKLTGYVLNIIVSLVVMMFVTRKMKIGPMGYFMIAISPMYINNMTFGNIEWLPWLGILMPLPIGLTFLVLRPQQTIGMIVLLFIRRFRSQGLVGVAIAALPTSVLLALNFIMYGLPSSPGVINPGRFDFFPGSLLIAIPLIVIAFIRNDIRYAAASSPLMAPYVGVKTYVNLLMPMNKYLRIVVVMVLLTLVFVFIL